MVFALHLLALQPPPHTDPSVDYIDSGLKLTEGGERMGGCCWATLPLFQQPGRAPMAGAHIG